MDNYQSILSQLKERFSENLVKQRKGPSKKINGRWETQMFSYIPTPYLQERLDQVLGLNWCWEILSELVIKVAKKIKDAETDQYVVKDVEQVVTKGRLTIYLPDGQVRYRDSYGGCELNYGTQAGDPFKISDSNAFKKACLKFGIGAYLATDGIEEDTGDHGENYVAKAAAAKQSAPNKSVFVNKQSSETQKNNSVFRIKR